jgi:HPt (histidine-containing phosphotransfer) domain-containing protein
MCLQEEKMKSTRDPAHTAPTPAAADDAFEELRQAFHARLRSDRVHLMTLGAELTRAAGDPGHIFEDMRLFAHRLRGASAIFEAQEIGIAAHALEQAACSAAVAHADAADASVWTALESLVDRLPHNSGSIPALNATSLASRPADPCEGRPRR